jgi:hypothetical protein
LGQVLNRLLSFRTDGLHGRLEIANIEESETDPKYTAKDVDDAQNNHKYARNEPPSKYKSNHWGPETKFLCLAGNLGKNSAYKGQHRLLP